MMSDKGFQVGRDPRVEKDYKLISKDYWYGRKGNLEFKARRYPRGFEIQFFQNIVFENQSGGYYDFDKYEKMPYLIRLSMVNTMNQIERVVISLGTTKTHGKTMSDFELAEDQIKFNYMSRLHKPQKNMDFNLDEVKHGQPDNNCLDRDKKRMENGETKYFRDHSGRLARGKAYHNINNMWWVIINKRELRNEACFELFDPVKEDFNRRRVVRERMPESYKVKREQLEAAKTRELIAELKRRGVKVA